MRPRSLDSHDSVLEAIAHRTTVEILRLPVNVLRGIGFVATKSKDAALTKTAGIVLGAAEKVTYSGSR